MTESVSLQRVSNQMLADIKSAFRSYTANADDVENSTEESRTYKSRGQITRKAYYDIQDAFPRNVETEDENTDVENTIRNDAANTNIQTNYAEAQKAAEANNIKVETKKFTLPKNADAIIAELKRNGMTRTMTAYQIADEYGISYMKAREILDKLNTDSNGFVREYNLPQYSTISFKV